MKKDVLDLQQQLAMIKALSNKKIPENLQQYVLNFTRENYEMKNIPDNILHKICTHLNEYNTLQFHTALCHKVKGNVLLSQRHRTPFIIMINPATKRIGSYGEGLHIGYDPTLSDTDALKWFTKFLFKVLPKMHRNIYADAQFTFLSTTTDGYSLYIVTPP